MRVEDYSPRGSAGAEIVTGMIVSPAVLANIASVWVKPGLFAERPFNIIGQACFDFFTKYKAAPNKHIEGLIRRRAERELWDQDHEEQITALLRSLSGRYKQKRHEINPDYLINLAQKHFTLAGGIRFADAYRQALLAGDEVKADHLLRNYKKIELGSAAGTFAENPLAYELAFAAKHEPLVRYSQGLGQFFGDQLCKGAFIAFVGRDKRGKSAWLLDLAFQAQICRKRVAFFEAGDMTQNQIFLRIGARAARKPFRRGVVKRPGGIVMKKDGAHPTDIEEEIHDTPLSPVEGYEAYQRFLRRKVKSTGQLLWVQAYPSGTLSVDGIRAALETKERQEGWVPDVVIVDYADLLVPPKGIRDKRDQYDAIWRDLRGYNQERENLLVTVSHCNRSGYGAKVLSMEHISEDRRKLAHVTGIVGINGSNSEKERGVTRLNWMILRDDDFSPFRCVHCAGCPSLYEMAVQSIYPRLEEKKSKKSE